MRRVASFVVLAGLGGLLWAEQPPVKMGLWEKTTVTTGVGTPDTMVSKSCVTPEAWQQMMARMAKPRPECTMNVQHTGQSYSYKGSCNTGHATMTIDGTQTIQDSEHIVSDSHTIMTIGGKTREVKNHSTSHYLGANCGKITPDDPEVEGDK